MATVTSASASLVSGSSSTSAVAAEVGARLGAGLLEFMAVGGLTLVLFPLAWLLRQTAGLDASEYYVGFTMFHAAHVINDPHFSVTYLLFYRDLRVRLFDRETGTAQRARYLAAGVLVPAVLVAWAWFALVSHSAQTLGNLIELLYLLVGWHYAKQGFGALMVLSARRGTRWTALERRTILAHCYLAWAFAWSNPARPAGEFEEKGVVYWSLSRPRWLELTTGGLLALSTLALLGCLTVKWRRERRLPLLPLLSFIVTIWLWTIFTTLDPLVRYAIPALHSIQYLYFVWLMKRNEGRASEGPPLFGPPVATRLTVLALGALGLGFLLLRGSALLDHGFVSGLPRGDASAALGSTPLFAASYVVVNIHHYFMDSVIWRRENPGMRYLQQAV